MLIKEYKDRGYNVRWTKDAQGVDIIKISVTTKVCPKRGEIERKSIRFGLKSLSHATAVIDELCEQSLRSQMAREAMQTKKRDLAYRKKWSDIYDNDQQDLY